MENLLDKYKNDIDQYLESIGSKSIEEILKIYEMDINRYYHNHNHIISILNKYLFSIEYRKDIKLTKESKRDINYKFILAILYHDIIYDSSSSTNEEDSASLIDYLNLSDEDKKYVKDIILFTKYKEPALKDTHKEFLILDFGILLEKDIDICELINHEILIRKEYLQYDLNSFVGGRYYVLQNLCKLLSDSNIEYKDCGIEKLMNYIEFIITSNTLQNSIYDI